MIELIPIYRDNLEETLRIMRPFYDGEDFDPAEIGEAIGERRFLPLMIYDGERERALAVLTLDQVGKRCEIRNCAGGNLFDWMPAAWEVIRALALEAGCDSLGVKGRPGWARRLRELGFRTEQVFMGVKL